MGREGVPKGVRSGPGRRARAPCPSPQPAPEIGRAEPPAALGEEHRALLWLALARQERPAALEVGVQRAPGLLADRDDPLLAALAVHTQLFRVEIGVAGIERCQLLGPQPGR